MEIKLLIYIISVIISWFILRYLRQNERYFVHTWESILIFTFASFIPFINIIYSIIVLLIYLIEKSEIKEPPKWL